MADISAELVKELRERTGAGFMDCKRALVESDGDLEKATLVLREKGLAATWTARSRTSFWNSSVRATKSVSQLTSMSTPTRPPVWM